MVRSLPPRSVIAVDVFRKEKGEQSKKKPCNLQPKRISRMQEGAEEGVAEVSGALADSRCEGSRLSVMSSGLPLIRGAARGAAPRGRRLRTSLVDHPGRYPDSDPQRAAESLRLHKKSLAAAADSDCPALPSEVR